MLTNYQLPQSTQDKIDSRLKIMVAMSGGVDSSTTAAILKHYGAEVIGVTLKLYDVDDCDVKSCCGGSDVVDAKNAARTIGIPHYIIDCVDVFKEKVIDYFIDSYIDGKTPIPCTKCNDYIKFGYLIDVAKSFGCNGLATGHYVVKKVFNNLNELHVSSDAKKDQTYFMFNLNQEKLDFLEFPIGHIEKKQTRDIANYFNLSIASKKESQDICFVSNNDYTEFIKKFRCKSFKKGYIVDLNDNILGHHDGIVNYTVGQRKGIGVSAKYPLYVLSIDVKNNKVVVGRKEDVKSTTFFVDSINWICNDMDRYIEKNICVKIRSSSSMIPASIFKKEDRFICVLNDYFFSITPGQACVMYDGSKVLGGGWISCGSI